MTSAPVNLMTLTGGHEGEHEHSSSRLPSVRTRLGQDGVTASGQASLVHRAKFERRVRDFRPPIEDEGHEAGHLAARPHQVALVGRVFVRHGWRRRHGLLGSQGPDLRHSEGGQDPGEEADFAQQ